MGKSRTQFMGRDQFGEVVAVRNDFFESHAGQFVFQGRAVRVENGPKRNLRKLGFDQRRDLIKMIRGMVDVK